MFIFIKIYIPTDRWIEQNIHIKVIYNACFDPKKDSKKGERVIQGHPVYFNTK